MIKKHDLKLGDIIQTNEGTLYVLTALSRNSWKSPDKELQLFFRRPHGYLRFTTYTEDMQDLANSNAPLSWRSRFKVVKVYRPENKFLYATTCYEVYRYNLFEEIKNAVDITHLGDDLNFIPLKAYVPIR